MAFYDKEGFGYGGIMNDPTVTGGATAGRDKLASDISSMSDMISRVNLGAIDARYAPFSGNKVQNTMNPSVSGLLRSGREGSAAMTKQKNVDKATANAMGDIRDNKFLDMLRSKYAQGANIAKGSTPQLMFDPYGMRR